MDRLLELLALLAAVTAETPEAEIRDLLALIDAEAAVVAADPDLDDEGLATLTAAAEAVETARAGLDERTAAAEQRAAEATAIADRIRAAASTDDEPGDEPGDDPDDDGETPDPDAPADEAPVDETPADAETPAADLEPVTAGGSTPPAPSTRRAPVVSRVAARRPAAAQPPARPVRTVNDLSLVASANAPGVTAGQAVGNLDQLSDLFARAIQSGQSYSNGPRFKMTLASAHAEFPEHLQLGADAAVNARRMAAIRDGVRREGSLEALAAAGGACAPYQVNYDQPFIGSDARPARDRLLTRVGADRGGVTYLPTIRLADVMGAVEFWDDDNGHVLGDAGTTQKPVLEVDCDAPLDADTYAVTTILQFGNFQARYFRERVETIMNAVLVAAARKSERKLLTLLGDACTAVTTGQLLGTSRDVLAGLDRAVAAQRNRYRMESNIPMLFGHPAWLIDQMRADLTRELPGSTDERLAMADQKIAAFFQARSVTPVALLDGETGQDFGPQADGALTGWPSTAVTYLYPEGEAFFLDGGSLELGIVRDSTLNRTNKFQVFAETSEGFYYNGAVDPLRIVMDTCPDGSSAATKTITPCTTGS